MRSSAFIVCLFWVSGRAVPAGPVIEGDEHLLQVLDDACRSNMEKFQKGSYHAIAEERQYDLGLVQRADVIVVWDGLRTRIEGHVRLEKPLDPEIGLSKPKHILADHEKRILDSRVSFLMNSDEWTEYYENSNRAMRSLNEALKEGRSEVMRLRPDEVWYPYMHGRSARPWLVFFDVKIPKDLQRISVHSENGRVSIHRETRRASIDLLFDLSQGGNLVLHDAHQTTSRRGEPDVEEFSHGELQWRNQADYWVPERIRYEFSAPNHREKLLRSFELTVADFHPDPPISSQTFTFESLPIPPNGKIEEYSGAGRPPESRRYFRKDFATKSVGKGSTAPSGADLDKLADKLRQDGLGSSQKSGK